MKKFISFLTLLLLTLGVSAQNFQDENFKYAVTNEDSKLCQVTGAVKQTEVYTIPETANGYTVVQIGVKAFQNDAVVKVVNLSAKLKTVGNYSFADCANLTTVNFVDGQTAVGNYTFSNCPKLKDVVLPKTLTSVGARAFLGCNSLTSVNIPAGIKNIGAAPFPACSNLKAINIEDGNATFKSIDGVLYKQGVNLVQVPGGLTEYSIPDNIEFIMIGAFWGCEKLTGRLLLPADVKDFGSQAFYHAGFTGEVDIPEGAKSLYTSLFEGCAGITKVVMPDVNYIRNNVFTGCISLKTVEFGNTNFGSNMNEKAFEGLTEVNNLILSDKVQDVHASFKNVVPAIHGLCNLTLGKNVATIPAEIFASVDLKEIVCAGETPATVDASTFSEATFKNAVLIVPKSALETYRAAPVWKEFKNIQTSGVDEIGAEFDVITMEWFNAEGMKVEKPSAPDGRIYICVETLSNGNIKTKKIINK